MKALVDLFASKWKTVTSLILCVTLEAILEHSRYCNILEFQIMTPSLLKRDS